eukprot:275328_1
MHGLAVEEEVNPAVHLPVIDSGFEPSVDGNDTMRIRSNIQDTLTYEIEDEEEEMVMDASRVYGDGYGDEIAPTNDTGTMRINRKWMGNDPNHIVLDSGDGVKHKCLFIMGLWRVICCPLRIGI